MSLQFSSSIIIRAAAQALESHHLTKCIAAPGTPRTQILAGLAVHIPLDLCRRVRGGKVWGPMDPAAAQAKLDTFMYENSGANSPLYDNMHPMHKQAVAEKSRLFAAMAPPEE